MSLAPQIPQSLPGSKLSSPAPARLTVPESLQQQLDEFRRRVWSSKMLEVVAAAAAGFLVAWVLVFALDRFIDTPAVLRGGTLLVVTLFFAWIPASLYRWVWRHRRWDQLARLLQAREPSIGDQLLGVVELATNDQEQHRSRALCAAAMQQVAQAARGRDLGQAAPRSYHAGWLGLAGAGLGLVVMGAGFAPQATWNSLARLMEPWKATPRFTFAMVEAIPEEYVVPHGEDFALDVHLAPNTQWSPTMASAVMPYHDPKVAKLVDGQYQFLLPAVTQPARVDLKVGDYMQRIAIVPKLRPELNSLEATVRYPEYLQLSETQSRDVRSGTLHVVTGSKASLTATASHPLDSATISAATTNPTSLLPNGSSSLKVTDQQFQTPQIDVPIEGGQVALAWTDRDGLTGREPFRILLQGRLDEAPSVMVEGLPRQAVVLDSEQLNFQVYAGDDFGLRAVGVQWKGVDDQLLGRQAQGERVLSAGGPDQSSLQLKGTFSAKDFDIEPQPIELRTWVEDYLPGRGRVYSAPHLLYVLTPDQHAIWMTEQLSKWHRQSLEVRDRELQLHETNKQLRELSADELDAPETRQRIESQAGAEAANGRRLTQLAKLGEDLVRQASRNSEIGVGHLERWAEMLQVLKDISGNRMPSVEDLLHQAAKASSASLAASPPKPSAPQAGTNRSPGAAEPGPEEEGKPKPPVPSIADGESSQQPPEANPSPKAEGKKKSKASRFTLPNTTIAGPNPKDDDQQGSPPDMEEELDEAIKEQAELLAEFEKIAEELNMVLANLEGSTLVKRLKAASREQLQVAGKISDRIAAVFGSSSSLPPEQREVLQGLAAIEGKSVQSMSYIMDDMQSYFERRRMNQFKLVLDEMRQVDVLSALRLLGDEIPKEQGMSIAQCEFWSDTMDRWADDLVDPACKGQCPGGKSKDSLPPSIVLEVLQVLEAEVNLREQTRVAEQSKEALGKQGHTEEGNRLSTKQSELNDRIQRVIERIGELPESQENFGNELTLLAQVDDLMGETTRILSMPETGKPAIAAETEIIELLLQSKRINPKAGGGSGSAPGGGGRGDTKDSALALVGTGVNDKEAREHRDVQQATGQRNQPLPEEFRSGLDEYFNRLDAQQ